MEAVVKSSLEFKSFTDFYRNSAYADFPQKHRQGGSFEVSMIEVEQAGHELVDPPIPQFAIVGVIQGCSRAEVDFGDGWTNPMKSIDGGMFGPQPMNQECRFRISGTHKLLCAFFPGSVVGKLLSNVGIFDDPFRSLYARFSNDIQGLAHLKGMWHAMKTGGPANNLLIDAHVISLLGLMLVEAQDIQQYVAAPSLDSRRLARVVDYIEMYFGEPLLTSELAAIAAMSPVHFNRAFKLATGYSPYQYLVRRRIEHSCRMLRSATLSVTQIAYLCGFAGSSHFSTVFAKALASSPSAYRSQFHTPN
jgi:AraC family transcriptional regulator